MTGLQLHCSCTVCCQCRVTRPNMCSVRSMVYYTPLQYKALAWHCNSCMHAWIGLMQHDGRRGGDLMSEEGARGVADRRGFWRGFSRTVARARGRSVVSRARRATRAPVRARHMLVDGFLLNRTPSVQKQCRLETVFVRWIRFSNDTISETEEVCLTREYQTSVVKMMPRRS
jgi:hypothetical protein